MRTALGVLLNLIFLPFGYYYLKQPRRFFLFLAAALLLSLLTAVLHRLCFALFGPGPALAFLVATGILWPLFLVFDSLRAARLAPAEDQWLRRPRAYLVVPLVLAAVLLAQLPLSRAKRFFSNLHNVGGISNMRPGLITGDFFYGSELFRRGELERGTVVVYRPRADRATRSTGRLIGLPGERVEIEETGELEKGLPFFRTRIKIDGRPLPLDCPTGDATGDPNAETEQGKLPAPRLCTEDLGGRQIRIRETLVPGSGLGQFAEIRLGPDQYFMLSDNRDIGADSRFHGPVDSDRILEIFLYTAFSLEFTPPDRPAADDACVAEPFRPLCYLKQPGRYRPRLSRSGAAL